MEWVEEPVPGYPKRPVPRDEEAAKALKKRTLTNLYKRSAAVAWAAETDHPREVIKAALAHAVQNKVKAAYARTELSVDARGR